jgi:hypothetical protein
MIVGCFQLDLYCDYENGNHAFKAFPVTYTGETRSRCMQQARNSGWTFWKVEGELKARCPLCSKNHVTVIDPTA